MLPKTGLSALGTFSPLGVNFTPANQKSENMASQQIKYLGTEPLFFHFRGRTSLTNMFLNTFNLGQEWYNTCHMRFFVYSNI
jgi:hypothetical protein